MSITKPKYSTEMPKGYKEPVWGTEGFVLWSIKILIQLGIFFFLLYTSSFFGELQDNFLYYFIFIFVNYLVSGALAFFISYIIIKFLYGISKYKVKSITNLLSKKTSRKKIWIVLFTNLFKTIFFILSVWMMLVNIIPISGFWAYIFAWLIISLISRLMGRLLYFTLYTY